MNCRTHILIVIGLLALILGSAGSGTAWGEEGEPGTELEKAKVGPLVKVALTFDDGPVAVGLGDENDRTGRIRAILAANDAKGTFFVEHSRIKSKAGKVQLKAAGDAGHEIGLHGAHPAIHHLSYALTEELAEKMERMKEIINEATGKDPLYVRPPGGESTLADHLEAGEVPESSKAIGGPKPVPDGVTAESIAAAITSNGLEDYLGDGTTGANSWLEEFTEASYDAAVDAVSKKMDEAKAENKMKRAIILLHDIRKFDEVNLDAFIKKLKEIAEKKDVAIEFNTLSKVIEE